MHSMQFNKISRGTSNKADKTVTVSILRKVKHPTYGKFVKKTTKIMAHDEKNECQIGDQVVIMNTRPLSKKKQPVSYKSLKPKKHDYKRNYAQCS